MMMWALILLAGVVAVPLVIEATRKPMNDKARATAPGQFVKLPQGVTHFDWIGPQSGRVVVCIHGLTTPSFVWRSMASGLATMGFRVLTYDLFGRGYSDRPQGVQDPEFFVRQLNDLLESQKVDDDLTLVGYSMGGAIAAAFAAAQPHAIRQVVLIAPAGMKTVGENLRFIVRIPILGLWLMLVRYPEILRRGLRSESHLVSSVAGIGALQEAELDFRGFIPAIHSSLSNTLSTPLQKPHEGLHREGIPVLAIWGADDAVIPIIAKDQLSDWNPDAQHHVIEDAGHGITYTHTRHILDAFETFIEQRD